MESSPVSGSVSTTTRLSIEPVPRIADVPLGMIGIPTIVPRTPGLVIVKVAPCISPGDSCRAFARVARSMIFLAVPTRLRSTAMPRFTAPL